MADISYTLSMKVDKDFLSNSVSVGINEGGSFVGFCTLRAGEPAILRLSAGTEYKARGTAGTRLRVDITEG